MAEEDEKRRVVTEDDKNCLCDALMEIKQSLSLRNGATFFDTSGVLCHGFSDSIIQSIVENSHKIFSVTDLMEYCFISSLQLAVMILDVFNELFEDITPDNSLCNLAVEMEPMYNALMDNVTDYELCLDQLSDSGD